LAYQHEQVAFRVLNVTGGGALLWKGE
jgi:hypothetical protein